MASVGVEEGAGVVNPKRSCCRRHVLSLLFGCAGEIIWQIIHIYNIAGVLLCGCETSGPPSRWPSSSTTQVIINHSLRLFYQ